MSEDDEDYHPGATTDLDDIDGTLHEILSVIKNKDSGGDLAGVVLVIVAMLLMSSWSGSKLDRFTDRMWYSVADETDWKNVNVVKRPRGKGRASRLFPGRQPQRLLLCNPRHA